MINIVIGSHKRFERVEPVIEHSIRKHTKSDINIIIARPEYFGYKDEGCTGFSKIRWMVPEIVGYKGFAIYLDVDMIVMSDIQELFEMRRKNRWCCLADGSTEVMVIDCEARKTEISRNIPGEWNVEDYSAEPRDLKMAKILHFTDLKSQPWFFDHPKGWLSKIWFKYEKDSKSF